MTDTIFIGIAGGTGSGKTTLTEHIKKRFGYAVGVIYHDNYYRDQTGMPFEVRCRQNYDHPDAFETDLMVRHLKALKAGVSIQCPVYSYTDHNRTDKTVEIKPASVIIVEGLLIFQNPELRDLMDIKIFVDTDADVRILRRILRDVKERGRTIESVVDQYLTTVKPMHEQFIEPSKRFADIIVLEGGHNLVALDMIMQRIATHLYFTTEGVIGTPLAVCSTFIFLFILFGAFLERTGIGQFFIDIANSLAGKATGGPAKVAVIASALQGTITGSSVANTVSSGSFTIPMMKKMGYRPEFAAAVEAAASTGGQIMPPIMGAAAFLMSEMTGIPYSNIIIAAIIPAFLYFTGIMIMVHLEAKRYGLKGLPPEEIPNFFRLMLGYWYLLIPLVVLVTMMMTGYTPARAALIAIVLSIVVSMFRKETRMDFSTFLGALEAGARNIIGVGVACAVAGMIVGTVTLTGIGLKLANGLLMLSGGNILLALFFTMIASIVLGMGVPTTANYVIMATITAPIVLQLGVDLLPAHMFVFYFGIVADITPPVALAAYAGSAIARSNPLKTGVQATKLAIAAFIIPYIFALNPSLLLIGSEPLDIILVTLTALAGMTGVAAATEGYIFAKMIPLIRIVSLIGGLMLIIPGLYTDLGGLALLSIAFVFQKLYSKKHL